MNNTSSSENIKGILAALFFSTLLLVVVFVILNYFNILSLSSLYPKQLSFLPHRPIVDKTTIINKKPSKLVIKCPVPKEYCDKGKEIVYQGQNLGLGFLLPKDTVIKAAFAGEVEIGSASGGKLKVKKHPTADLYGKEDFNGYIASYDLFGILAVTSDDKTITKGDTIGAITEGSYPEEEPFGGVNLIFYITRGNSNNPPISLSEFEIEK